MIYSITRLAMIFSALTVLNKNDHNSSYIRPKATKLIPIETGLNLIDVSRRQHFPVQNTTCSKTARNSENTLLQNQIFSPLYGRTAVNILKNRATSLYHFEGLRV
ncbi:hypothetical protein ACH5RR_023508 [Cinchona calisaya]|uniref:Secreted protein n=1 Tax=Cinchona calisaya TaxID=153742 RepID=A0ABD2ZAW1_9GENT